MVPSDLLMDIPSRQKQWEQRGRGLPFDILHIAEVNVLRSAPGSDDVLIQVKAVGFRARGLIISAVGVIISY